MIVKIFIHLKNYFVSIICRSQIDSMDSDTFYGDFVIKLIWRLPGNLIHHAFFKKTPDNLQTNFTINSL